MLTSKDLMIGDWVKMNSGPARITVIKEGEIHFVDRFGRGISPCCEGLPLTAEILEKNGFAYFSIGGAEQWLINDDYYDINVYEYSDSIWVFRYDCTEMSLPHTQVTMSYVHELQHALRLCGIEKEIEL